MQARTCIDYLKRAGYKVVHAADGEQALWLYRRETPDLILMDVIMPKMSGFEVAKKIREEDFSTPILFISSLTHSQHAIDGFDLGANDYIRKEVLLDEVVARVNRCLKNVGMLKVETDFVRISDNISFNPIRRYLIIKGETNQLTPMETRVLKILCLKKNQYVDKEELVKEGWGNDFKESYRYLDKVIARLRKYLPKGGAVEIVTSWAEGNENVILCERGIRTFETSMRNTLDLAGVVMLHKMTHLPVVVDPSHACGHAWMVPELAKAAVAAGADGLMIEVHNNPAKAKCDGAQSLTPDQFDELMHFIGKEVEFFGKKMN